MKRTLIVFVILTLFLCGFSYNKKRTEEIQQRFVIEYQQRYGAGGTLSIIRDTATGKAYLFVRSDYAGGLTILEGET